MCERKNCKNLDKSSKPNQKKKKTQKAWIEGTMFDESFHLNTMRNPVVLVLCKSVDDEKIVEQSSGLLSGDF